jgi:16S rRNA (uracil1498-N3)-methyltransferase
MTRRRFYVPRDLIKEGSAALPPTQAHHLRDVLRLHSGDIVEIFDGAGSGYTGEVELRDSDVFIRSLKNIPSPESSIHLTLAAALIKSAKFEWMLEKSTELGVDAIIPLKTCLSEIRIPSDRMKSRLERWRRIVREASRQCTRFTEPRISEPLDFSEFLASQDFTGSTKVLFYEKSNDPWRSDGFVSDRILLCIGPEGGWEPHEIEQARGAGYRICGLGPRILRAETAAIAAVSIVQHELQLLSHSR